ncbi:YdbH domain-containing protein [Phenylobacterium sp. LjRoot225]|uniref:intermembrane phospholipid transport protein YdbH family protein n=1 Tax=Phenylobacterium sp. LjRoot225 TaxID=3342285 RepID=UPI003ED087A1
MTEAAPPTPARRLRPALVILGVVAVVAALLLYAARRTIAREALTGWLKSKGVAASAEVQSIGPTGVTGSIVIGDPGHPDLTIARADVGYGLRGLNFEVRSVRLVRPVLRARLKGGQLSAGELDPLIAQFRKAPPRTGAVQPRIVVEGGVVALDTGYGRVRIEADAKMVDGRLQQLSARTAPTRLRSDRFDVSLGETQLTAQAAGGRVELSLDAPIASGTAGGLSATNARLRMTAAGPYPDLKRKRETGAVVAHAELSGGRLALGGQALRNGQISAALTGQAAGWIDDLTLTGRAVADLRAGGAEAGGGQAGTLRAAGSAEDLRWTRKGGDLVQARIAASASLDSYARDALNLSQVTAAARGPVRLSRKGADLDLVTHALGHGAWSGLGAPVATDSANMAAVKRAAAGFRFTAPAVAVRRQGGGAVRARLVQPVRLTPDRGGSVTFAPAGAGWKLTAAGGGLPKVDADIVQAALAPGGGVASGRIKAALSIGPIERGVFDASGALRLADGVVSFTGDRCASMTAPRANFGANDVRGLSGRLCPAGSPLLSLGGGDWRIAGRAEDVAAEVPFLQARVAKGAGTLDLAARKGALQAKAGIAAAEVSDAAPVTRFRPVGISGQAQLARELWTAAVAIRDGAGRPLATARLKHESLSGRGGVEIDSGTLRFAQGGLQPADLSPLAAAVGSPAQGEAQFTGGFAWTPAAQTSAGVLEIPNLDFQSPAGAVSGLSGRVAFTSLAPLVAAPGQTLQAASVATPVAPLTEVRIAFGLQPDALRVTGGQAAVGGGLARIESLEIPLAVGQPIRGVVNLDGVQLHDLVEASPFGDRVELDAKVSGRIPFTTQGDKVRVQGGTLHAVQPGRLSIQRTALTNVEASGAVETSGAPAAVAPEPSTDTFSDFAYQAMEHLAFSTLTAGIDSRDDGRLAVLFHIIGKHDPPQRQEIRLSFLDLIQKKFLGRKLPLPSDTGVDLTLDTTLNLDDLLGDYAEFRRLHGSAQVQP